MRWYPRARIEHVSQNGSPGFNHRAGTGVWPIRSTTSLQVSVVAKAVPQTELRLEQSRERHGRYTRLAGVGVKKTPRLFFSPLSDAAKKWLIEVDNWICRRVGAHYHGRRRRK